MTQMIGLVLSSYQWFIFTPTTISLQAHRGTDRGQRGSTDEEKGQSLPRKHHINTAVEEKRIGRHRGQTERPTEGKTDRRPLSTQAERRQQ